MTFFSRENAVFEKDINGCEGDPSEEKHADTGENGLHLRTEGEELHPPIAADIDLPFGERMAYAPPGALPEQIHYHPSLDALADRLEFISLA
jgi:hypothetical protein